MPGIYTPSGAHRFTVGLSADEVVTILNASLTKTATTIYYTIPTGKVYLPLALFVTLTNDATVGNRRVTSVIRDESNNILYAGAPATSQTASNAASYCSGNSIPTYTSITGPWPVGLPQFLPLKAGWKIGFESTLATGASAGAADAWSNGAFTLQDIS